MTIENSGLIQIIDKFPEHGEEIKKLFRDNESFQTLCEDYHQCITALQHWKRSSEKEAPARRQEYEMLFQGLVDEIFLCLSNSN